jgi:hypothetical protein
MTTRRFSISLPEDVAGLLDGVPNASAHIAEALRHHDRLTRTRQVLETAGYVLDADRVAAMRTRVAGQLSHIQGAPAEATA